MRKENTLQTIARRAFAAKVVPADPKGRGLAPAMKPTGFLLSVLCGAVCGSNCVAGTLAKAYVANQGNNTIEAFNSSGSGSVFATGLSGPQGLALDSAGNLYVCYGNSVLQ